MVNTEIRLIMFFAAKDGEALHSQEKQDQELTMAQIMNSLLPNSDLNWKKYGKSLEHLGMTEIKSLMTIQWKWEIDLKTRSDRVPEELWMEVHDIVQEAGITIIPKKEKCKKAKWLSEEALQIAEEKREATGKGEKERYTHLNAEF